MIGYDELAVRGMILDRHVPPLAEAGFAQPLSERALTVEDPSAALTYPTTGNDWACAMCGHIAAVATPAMNSRRRIRDASHTGQLNLSRWQAAGKRGHFGGGCLLHCMSLLL
jgi:hypothetical protein